MRIALDRTRCTGHGRCYTVAPAVFDADDDGYGRVREAGAEVAPGAEQAARRGAANCPEDAISVEE